VVIYYWTCIKSTVCPWHYFPCWRCCPHDVFIVILLFDKPLHKDKALLSL